MSIKIKPTIYVLLGLPGSGKTTLAHHIANKYGATIQSYDDVPGANNMGYSFKKVKEDWVSNIRNDLLQGQNVVIDGLLLYSKDRVEMLSALDDIDCVKFLLYKQVPVEICLERNRGREARLPDFIIQQSARKLEPPSKDEGWDQIFLYKD